MFKHLKYRLTTTQDNRRLIANIFSLGILQIATYILPLITLPYLVRILGPDIFGLLAFATATVAYFTLITDYGFNLSATRQISVHRDDKEKVSEIFSSVMTIKVTLLSLCSVLLILLIISFEKFSQHSELYFITFGVVVGQALFPVWLFQGMEQMRYITLINVAAKTFFTICIFVFVKESADYLLVPLITSVGFIVAGIWSLYLAKKELKVIFTWQSNSTLKCQLAEGWHVFVSSMAISLYTISTTFVLGLFANGTTVGHFAAVDKIVHAVKGLYTPISQAIYPQISKLLNSEKQKGISFIYKTILVVGLGALIASIILYIFASPIVNLFLGVEYEESVLLLKIMAFTPFLVVLSNIFGIQTMLNLGYQKEFTFILVVYAILGLCLSVFLTGYYGATGLSATILIIETLITGTLGFFVLHRNKKGKL